MDTIKLYKIDNSKITLEDIKKKFKDYKSNNNTSLLFKVIYYLNTLFTDFIKSNIEAKKKTECIKKFNPYNFHKGVILEYEIDILYNYLLQNENNTIQINQNQKIIKDLSNIGMTTLNIAPFITYYKFLGHDLNEIIYCLINEWENFLSE